MIVGRAIDIDIRRGIQSIARARQRFAHHATGNCGTSKHETSDGDVTVKRIFWRVKKEKRTRGGSHVLAEARFVGGGTNRSTAVVPRPCAPSIHDALAPGERAFDTRCMKPTSSSIRSFLFARHLVKLGSIGALCSATTLLAIGCGEAPIVRNNGSAGSGNSGGSGGNGGSGGSVVPNDPLPLRVVNWNVHNLENDKDDSGAPGETIVSAAEYTKHRKSVGVVLNEIDADVVLLTEVENKAVLDDLNASELGGKYVATSLIDGNDYRGVDIAVLSKIPIDMAVSHKDDAFPLNGTQGPNYYFSRDCPEIHIQFNGRKMVFLGVHLKAKSNDDPVKRLAEAQHTRAIANSLLKEDSTRAIVMLGDYNDTPGSPPYLAVVGEGSSQYTDVTLSIPMADRWTYDYQGKLELIDYQIVNPVLAPMIDPQSVDIVHSGNVDAASDHAPVVATYLVN
jgi:endonuclease/exonuclease/phosphatase family metal-dependent hydrolase